MQTVDNSKLANSEQSRSVPEMRFEEFNDNWQQKTLGEVGDLINGLTYSPKDISDDGILVLRSSNIQNNQLAFEDNVYVNVESYNPVEENDILICVRNGSKRLIGKNCLIDKNNEGVAFGAFMTVYRSNKNKFIFHLFSLSSYYKTIHQNLGATINSINNNDLKKFKFFFPSLTEQQKIASFLSSVDEKLQQLNKKKSLLEDYKKGVMQKIFSQELRFKDDNGNNFPDWEEKKLGDISSKSSSNISANKIEDNNGKYLIYGASGTLKRIDFYNEEQEYIAIVKDGAGVGRTFICQPFSSVLGTMDIIKSKEQNNLYFIYSVINNINFKKYTTGSTIPHIYFKDYSKEKIKVPRFEEQQKIANFLSAIDEKITLTNIQIDNTKAFKKGLLQQMFV